MDGVLLVAALVQIAVGAATLGYLVFGLAGRMAVLEFKVDQLWRWRSLETSSTPRRKDAGSDRG